MAVMQSAKYSFMGLGLDGVVGIHKTFYDEYKEKT
jgi:hypothetical protein